MEMEAEKGEVRQTYLLVEAPPIEKRPIVLGNGANKNIRIKISLFLDLCLNEMDIHSRKPSLNHAPMFNFIY